MGERPFANEEPNQVMREFAANMRQMYVALVQAGFTEREAMNMITEVIRTSLTNLNGGAP